jgi:predicted flap endonuclease-1-like 5' DNA nuclease
MKIIEIIGLEKKYAKLLEKEGYSDVKDLLPLNRNQIKKLAKKIGISAELLDTWQEHADLMRIEGVSPEYANALNQIGIDSVKEFARRNLKNTIDKLRTLKKNDPKIISKLPILKSLEGWIKKAKSLSKIPESKEDKGGKKPVPKKKPKPKKKPQEVIDNDYGEYGPDYWNNKWKKEPIIYTGRALRGESYYKQIDADVKVFIKKDDAILWHVISQAELKKPTNNETALACQKFVCDFLKYKYDEEIADCPEFWQFPFESIQSGIGDCEYRLRFASIAKMERS